MTNTRSAAIVNFAPEKGSVEIREISVPALEKKMFYRK
jgi:hypothetical protein